MAVMARIECGLARSAFSYAMIASSELLTSSRKLPVKVSQAVRLVSSVCVSLPICIQTASFIAARFCDGGPVGHGPCCPGPGPIA